MQVEVLENSTQRDKYVIVGCCQEVVIHLLNP